MSRAYREAPSWPPPFRVVHGPFPLRPGRVAGGVVLVALAALLSSVGLESQELVCGAEPDAWCVLSEGGLRQRELVRFRRSDLGAVRVETRWGGKGNRTEYGRAVLAVSGRWLRTKELGADDARELAARLDRARNEQLPIRERVRGPRWLVAIGALLLAAAVSLVASGLRGVGRLIVEVDPRAGRVSVKRRLLGISGKATHHDVGDVTDVRVELSEESDLWRTRSEPARAVGRLVLLSSNGGRQELSARAYPGRVVHLRAAAALRRGLELPEGPLEHELAELEAVRERPAWAANLGTASLIWLGAPVGLLLGIGAYGGVGLALGALRLQDPLSPAALIVGGGLGALASVALLMRLARPRPPP